MLPLLALSACTARGGSPIDADPDGGVASTSDTMDPPAPPARAADPSRSTVEVLPARGVIADGLSAYTITVILRDATDQPVGGARVLLESDQPLAISQPQSTNDEGRTAGSASSIHAGTARVTIQVELPDGSFADFLAVDLEFLEGCRSDAQALEEVAWAPVFSRCVGCHNTFGLARSLNLTFQMVHPGHPDWARINTEVLRTMAAVDVETPDGARMPRLVAKPSGLAEGHSGGIIIQPGSEEFRILEAMVALLREPDACTGTADDTALLLESVERSSPKETFVRAKQILTARPVSFDELASMPNTEEALDQRLDALLSGSEYLERIEEYFDDWLLTKKMVERVTFFSTVNLGRGYTRQFWARPACSQPNQSLCCDTASDTCCVELYSAEVCNQLEEQTAESLGREPIELLEYLVKNDRPLSELVTADYGMFSPLSARVRGMPDEQMALLFDQDPTNDAEEFVPAVLSDTAFNEIPPGPSGSTAYPHAGILNMPSVMGRYPAGSKQRSRAFNLILDRLLAVPLMQFAEFNTAAVPLSADLEQATQQYQACSACHSALDPVAGFFNHWAARTATYLPNQPMPSFMPEPALGEAVLPADPDRESLQWVAPYIADHPRFAYAMVLPLFVGLTGGELLDPPRDPLAFDYLERALAYRIQNRALQLLARDFEGLYGLRPKPLIKAILKGPFFRARTVNASGVEARALALAGVGRGSVVTPEQLSRRLEAVTGWRYTPDGATHDFLTAPADCCSGRLIYRFIMGGIDYDTTTQRYRSPTPLVARVQERMSNVMACRAVMQDFSRTDPSRRALLPQQIALDTMPSDPAEEALIRSAIAHLHLVILGEELVQDDPELEQSFAVWRDAFELGRQLLASGGASASLPNGCRAIRDPHDSTLTYPRDGHAPVTSDPEYTARAWVALVSYLFSDARFLEE